MPKFDFILKPGESIPDELVPVLEKRLTSSLRQKLLKHGGLIRVSVASPYVDRTDRKPAFEIDAAVIIEMEQLASEPEQLREKLAPLTIKQLKQICALLNLPTPSGVSSRETRDAIIRRLQSGHIWEKISRPGNPIPEEQ